MINYFSGAINFDDVSNVSESEMSLIKSQQNEIQPDECCDIYFTSGTTGKPKATLLSHFNNINTGSLTGYRLEMDKEQHRVCLNVPFFHTFAGYAGFVPGLIYGSSLYIASPRFNADAAIECVQKYNCTYIFGTPTMYVDMISKAKINSSKVKSLRYALTSGAPITPQLLVDIQRYLGIKEVKSIYGMTECCTVFQSVRDEKLETVLEFVGKAQDHVEVKVVDTKGNMVPFGESGELWVRGYGTMLGYFEDEEKTRETIRSDRWLRTGDQFVLYENGSGKFVGRVKEMINRGGENIFPKEIEDFLITHPAIEEVHVSVFNINTNNLIFWI